MANTSIDVSCEVDFSIVSSFLADDKYTSSFVSTNPEFNFDFGYLIDLNFVCPTTGDIYHQTNYIHCASNCNGGVKQYGNNTDFMCYPCHSQCYKCTGPASNECTACYTNPQDR